MRLLRTTRGRLTLLAGGILLIALIISNLVLALALVVSDAAETDARLRDAAVRVSADIHLVDGRIAYSGGALPHETAEGTAVDMAVVRDGGVALSTAEQPFDGSALVGLAGRVESGRGPILLDATDRHGTARRVYVVSVTLTGNRHVAVVASTPLAGATDAVTRTILLMAALSLATLVAGTALTYWLVGRTLKPVSRIAALAETLSERQLYRRVDVAVTEDEVGELVRTFNRMLERLEASFAALRHFTSDASHELRGPLAIMATEVELSLGRSRTEEQYRQTLGVLEDEIDSMSRMVETLLLLARSDANQLRPRRSALDMVDFLHEAVARWQAVSGNAVKLELDVPLTGEALADEELTRRALDNLIDNAVRYSGGGPVRLHAVHAEGGWLIRVMDAGPGVPKELRAQVFERFARADRARAHQVGGGTGLGLPLSRAFMRAQGGDLRLGEESGWGAVFELWLPD